MPTTIQIKRRTADSTAPTSLEEGELAINTVSQKLYAGIAGGGGAFEIGPDSTQTLTNKTLTTPTIGDLTNAEHNHQDAAGGATLDTAAVDSGTFADARIAESNVTQHEEAIDHDALLNSATNEHIDWTNAPDNLQTSGTLESSIATGTAPLIITSTTAVANLATAMPYGHAWQTAHSSASADEIIFGAAGVGTRASGVTWNASDYWEIDEAGVYEVVFTAIVQPSSGTGWVTIYIKLDTGSGFTSSADGTGKMFGESAGFFSAVKNPTVRNILDLDTGDKLQASIDSDSASTMFLRLYSQFTIRRIA